MHRFSVQLNSAAMAFAASAAFVQESAPRVPDCFTLLTQRPELGTQSCRWNRSAVTRAIPKVVAARCPALTTSRQRCRRRRFGQRLASRPLVTIRSV